MVQRIKTFFTESWTELRHVNWPTRQEAMRLTSVVIGISLGIAVFLGLFDYLFTTILKAAIAP
ncbi:MAG: preprotein translocase subunit SecE [Minisyncoccia bacterium]